MGLADLPSASSVIIPDSSGSEESLALVINRIERVPLPEGRVGGDKPVAELHNAPEGAATSVNPLLGDGPGPAEGVGSGASSGASSLEEGTTSGRLESATVAEGANEAGRFTTTDPALESPGMSGKVLLSGLFYLCVISLHRSPHHSAWLVSIPSLRRIPGRRRVRLSIGKSRAW